jgi:putative nucleotidyltransferase with HDIG domain
VRRLDTIAAQFAYQTTLDSTTAHRDQSAAQSATASTTRFAVAGLIGLGLLIALFALALRRMPTARVRELDDLGRSFDVMAAGLTAGREALQSANDSLEDRVRERTRDLETARLETLSRLARAAELRDEATHEHTERVARTAQLLGRAIGLSEEDTELLWLAAPLHDIGKIGVPDAVLLKPGKLTDDEFALMQTHAELGAHMLSGSVSPVLQTATQIALSHHERGTAPATPSDSTASRSRSRRASWPSLTSLTPSSTNAPTSQPGPFTTHSKKSPTKAHDSSTPRSSTRYNASTTANSCPAPAHRQPHQPSHSRTAHLAAQLHRSQKNLHGHNRYKVDEKQQTKARSADTGLLLRGPPGAPP